MTATVADILAALDAIAPFSLAESWDNVGLMVGAPRMPVHAIHLGLDPSPDLLTEAKAAGANLLITHHPAIFRPLKSIRTDRAEGQFLATALRDNLAVVGVHTNLDVIRGGVSTVLATRLGLERLAPLAPRSPAAPETGFGQIGTLPAPLEGQAFLRMSLHALGLPVLAVAGPLPSTVRTVAVCGGSGSDLAETAKSMGADLYLSAEIKHNVARWAEAEGFCVIDAGHYATEVHSVAVLADLLRQSLEKRGVAVPITTTSKQTNPFTHYVNVANGISQLSMRCVP